MKTMNGNKNSYVNTEIYFHVNNLLRWRLLAKFSVISEINEKSL